MESKGRIYHEAQVASVTDITPLMRRVTLQGRGLAEMQISQLAQWVKVFFPAPDGAPKVGRAYTVRRFDRSTGIMDIDFALHGDSGPASRWALSAKAGDVVEVAGPRIGHTINVGADAYLLVGDATSLPAIAAILEDLPASMPARVFVEVASASEQQHLASRAQIETHWIHSGKRPPGSTGGVVTAVRTAPPPIGSTQIWLAGESAMVRSLRDYFRTDCGISDPLIDAKGYWKLGVADARD